MSKFLHPNYIFYEPENQLLDLTVRFTKYSKILADPRYRVLFSDELRTRFFESNDIFTDPIVAKGTFFGSNLMKFDVLYVAFATASDRIDILVESYER